MCSYQLSEVGNQFPNFFFFHEASIQTFTKGERTIFFRISGGFHPYTTDIFLEDIIHISTTFANFEDSMKYFAKAGCVGHIDFVQQGSTYKVTISDNYTVYSAVGWYKGISFEDCKKLPEETREVTNELIIECDALHFQVHSE